jgi:ubiquitin-conjugating enzyme E2 J1
MQEAKELHEPTEMYHAHPVEDNLFEWHFTVRGAPDTSFAGGIYHGRITLPAEYPMKPPSIMLYTPNGRFAINTKICLSISGYHPESWQPSWSIRTALLAIIGFMPTPGNGAIGALDYTDEERQLLAKKSVDWRCQTCNVCMKEVLLPLTTVSNNDEASEAKELAKQIEFKDESTNASAASTFSAPTVNVSSETVTTDATSVQPASEQNDQAQRAQRRPRVRRERRITSSQAHDSTPAFNYNVMLLNALILLVAIALAYLIFRRIYMDESIDTINSTANINDISVMQSASEAELNDAGETRESEL